MTRAALYARVSSQEQTEGYSIDAQVRAFRNLCESKGWTIFNEYLEEGRSAHTENVNKRPVFKQAMTDAFEHAYDVLVVHKIDRFSRKLRITMEYFDRLAKVDIGFHSITEQMDFSTAFGKFTLGMLGGLAELYSDNLSLETKKGWNERKAQGLYCGPLPFGAMKGEDGVPVPDTIEIEINNHIITNYDGLLLAFDLASKNMSDREVATALNAEGYRTTSNHGPGLFRKDTIRSIVTNRFYLGYLPDGNSGWLKGKHKPFIDEELFNIVQESREHRRTYRHNSVRREARIYSLSGLMWDNNCGSKVRVQPGRNDRPRVFCAGRSQTNKCTFKSTYLEVYEAQLLWYLEQFTIPEDYQQRILEDHQKLHSAYDNTTRKRQELQSRMDRLKDMYSWGHINKNQYLAEFKESEKQLKALIPAKDKGKELEKLAHFLSNIADAWREAFQEQRNSLSKALFEKVWLEDKRVVAVQPKEDLRPFFQLSHEELYGESDKVRTWRPWRDSNPRPAA